ncbi:PPOX class F420-dependent oxidoreductase [Rugosimonospora africana]|uniref:PPOX class F420-dependent enzyme n=1 Tax=Rugosimonospora africana TaxID=556532 RepID=A0A8J3QXR4_9ACTN|nr:PPOX class F420-dependent oxidoreductase [Rugosimonospora africana]GIH18082.1 PPOX class F420-dependent enzyme [Rugosimonospora africana]
MTVVLDEKTRKLLDDKNFGIVATLGPDGAPHSAVVWVAREEDTVLFSTLDTRQKARNLARDSRISVSVFAADNPYQSVEIRGVAELVDDPEKSLPMRLSRKYLGIDPPAESPDERRLIVRIHPTKVISFSA